MISTDSLVSTSDAAAESAPASMKDRASELINGAQAAQQAWADVSLRDRLKTLVAWRRLIAMHATELAQTVDRPGRLLRETLVAEVLPVCRAIRFLERCAPRLLRPRRSAAVEWPFIGSTRVTLLREPAGVVLILGPENYPLFLPGVQLAQALCAGNAVLLKPAPHASRSMRLLLSLADQAGVPTGLVTLLNENDLQIVPPLLQRGIDRVLLTGSTQTGARILEELAEAARETGVVTPATLELSGCDAVFVQRDADLNLVARSLAFALCFNTGATCVGPRRVFISPGQRAELETRLIESLKGVPSSPIPAQAIRWIRGAVQDGASIAGATDHDVDQAYGPVVLTRVKATMSIARKNVMSPVTSIIEAETDDEALELYAQCPYALAAAVFGSGRSATQLAGRINAGVVTINDLIVPHADPRVPLAPRGASGFGVSRGAEGLLELTRIKAVTRPASRTRFHLRPAQAGDSDLFAAWIAFAHGKRTFRLRLNAIHTLWRAVRERGRSSR